MHGIETFDPSPPGISDVDVIVVENVSSPSSVVIVVVVPIEFGCDVEVVSSVEVVNCGVVVVLSVDMEVDELVVV